MRSYSLRANGNRKYRLMLILSPARVPQATPKPDIDLAARRLREWRPELGRPNLRRRIRTRCPTRPPKPRIMKARADLLAILVEHVKSWACRRRPPRLASGSRVPASTTLLRGKLGKFSLDALVNLGNGGGSEARNPRRHSGLTHLPCSPGRGRGVRAPRRRAQAASVGDGNGAKNFIYQ